MYNNKNDRHVTKCFHQASRPTFQRARKECEFHSLLKNTNSCVECVWTFAVELEAGQLGVNANRNGSDLVKGGAQRLLVTHRDLLVAVTGGSSALGTVLARLVLNTTATVQFSLNLQEQTVK